MPVLEDIENIFSILHDGTISEWIGDKEVLTLTVECEYLAERINNFFDKFYVELHNIDMLEMELWMNNDDLSHITKTELLDIFEAELEILSADINNGSVIITCNQSDKSFNYSGGNLKLSCQSIKVFDQNKNELSIEKFEGICRDYWEEWSKK